MTLRPAWEEREAVHLGDSPLPLLLPGAVIALVVGLAASGVVGRALRVRRVVAGVLIVAFGVILAATLTPQREALHAATSASSCDMSRLGLASLAGYLDGDAAGNVLLFIPLGAALGLVPRSRRKAALVVAAIALPFAIETIQLLVPWLDRGCESADVVDNLTGLVLGLAGGAVAGRLAEAGRRDGGGSA